MTDWTPSTVSLATYLGDLALFSIRFRVLVNRRHFTELPASLALADLPALEPELDGYLIRSQPDADAPDIDDGVDRSRHVQRRLSRDGGYLVYVPRRYRRHWVDLTTDHAAYLARFSGKTRSTLRRKVKRFAQEDGGRLDFRVYRTPDEVAAFHHLARPLSARTYQERLVDAGLPKSEAFQTEMRARAERGAVRAYLLFLAGEPVAFTYCPIDDGIVLYGYTGFDSRCRALSPGTVLQYLILEDLFHEGGHRLFDFTEGEGAHKELFATDARSCKDVYVFRPGPKARFAAAAQTAVEQGAESAAAVLDRLGLKRRLKLLLRGAN